MSGATVAAAGRICVYCGSSDGADPDYIASAKQLGQAIVDSGFELVYGGANRGLMGAVADSVLDMGGRVIGIMPRSLVNLEVAHQGLTELIICESMHERKAQMADMSAQFIAMPGGLGTFEELFEIWTWSQLGLHQKPFGILNVKGYYDHLTAFLDHATREGFIKSGHRDMLAISDSPAGLLAALAAFTPSTVNKLS